MEDIFTARIAGRPSRPPPNFRRNNNNPHQPVLTAIRIYRHVIKEKDWLGAMIAARDAPLTSKHDIPRRILHLSVPGYRWTLDVWM